MVSLVYNTLANVGNIENVMLIDDDLSDKQLFFDSCNDNTFPIIYSTHSNRDELLSVLNNFKQGIKRMVFTFHDLGKNEVNTFFNNEPFFLKGDFEDAAQYSPNVQFLIDIVKQFNISNIDFLACNTFSYLDWKQYYDVLHKETGVVVGASTNKTGNAPDGDWIMDSTGENIQNVYFNELISEYSGTLAVLTISKNGGNMYLKYFSGDDVVKYSLTDQSDGSFITISLDNYPITITNSAPSVNNVLTVNIVNDLVLKNIEQYIIIGSQYIIIQGTDTETYKQIIPTNISSYEGFVKNGRQEAGAYSNITIQYLSTNHSSSTMTASAGWLCRTYFGWGVANILIKYCSNYGNFLTNSSGGICGSYFANGSGANATITNCSNYGLIVGSDAGGICGQSAGNSSGTLTITSCSNYSDAEPSYCGGICGSNCSSENGQTTITNCSHFGTIGGGLGGSGGICGSNCSYNRGSTIISNCFSVGNVIGANSGGICGDRFAALTARTNSITNCYSIGTILGTNSGGICGSLIGFNNNENSLFRPTTVSITNCYSIGALTGNKVGGIVGSTTVTGNTYLYNPTVNITNCYSNGTITVTSGSNASGGIIVPGESIPLSVTNSYIGNGSWSDATAKTTLLDAPINDDKVGIKWFSTSPNTPYLLSIFNNNLYNPKTAYKRDGLLIYTTNPGLQLNSSYTVVSSTNPNVTIDDATGALTIQNDLDQTLIFVCAYKLSNNQFYNYNINTFTITQNICFKDDTLILCLNDNVEQYVQIKNMVKGMLVKTLDNTFKPVAKIGCFNLYNSGNDTRTKDGIYRLSKQTYPDLIEDLIVTGKHNILIDEPYENQMVKYEKKYNKIFQGKYKLPTFLNQEATPYDVCGNIELWNFCLESDKETDYHGVYANGLLTECTSYQNIHLFNLIQFKE